MLDFLKEVKFEFNLQNFKTLCVLCVNSFRTSFPAPLGHSNCSPTTIHALQASQSSTFSSLLLSRKRNISVLVSPAITPGSLSLETSGRGGQKTQILLENPAFFPHMHPHSPPPSFLSITVPACRVTISRNSSYTGSSWALRQGLRSIPQLATHSHYTLQPTRPDTDT